MARVQMKRHDVIVDMTPFVDVAFLILTFFILTATFHTQDVEDIVTPKSISSLSLEESDLMKVDITSDGRFFFTPIGSNAGKAQLLQLMSEKYKVTFDEAERNGFISDPNVAVPMSQMKSYLHLSDSQRKELKAPGIPLDDTHKELIDWIKFSLQVNPSARLAVKGDAKAQYPEFKRLFEDLRDIDFYKFTLITTQK